MVLTKTMIREPAEGIFSPREIHEVAETITGCYYREFGWNPLMERLDAVRLAERILGISVSMVAFSGMYAPLGFTSAAGNVGVPVLDEDGREYWYFLDGNTILVEKRRACYRGSGDSYRFTVAHEVAHLLLDRHQTAMVSGNVMERQADDFATALLLPEKLVRLALFRFGFEGRVSPSVPGLSGNLCDRFLSMADFLGVSAEKLALRLRNLRMMDDSPAVAIGLCRQKYRDE